MSDREHALQVGADLQRYLEEKKQRVYQELRAYPTPITACDQQFNYLLDEQAGIVQELAALRGLLAEVRVHGDPLGLLGGFVHAARCLDDDARRSWIERLARLGDACRAATPKRL